MRKKDYLILREVMILMKRRRKVTLVKIHKMIHRNSKITIKLVSLVKMKTMRAPIIPLIFSNNKCNKLFQRKISKILLTSN